MDVKFDEEVIRLIILFENFTGSSVKDCIVDESSDMVYMIVEEGKLGNAIGKDGKNIRAVEKIIKRNVKLFEFCPDINVFAKRLIPQTNRINLVGKKLEVWVDKRYRAVVIGRDKRNLNLFKKIFERNFGIEDVIIR